jgi:hypothetical protein
VTAGKRAPARGGLGTMSYRLGALVPCAVLLVALLYNPAL